MARVHHVPIGRRATAVPAAAAQTDAGWRRLYRISAVCAVVTACLIPIQVTVFAVWPPPSTAKPAQWFALFEQNRLLGLLSLDGLFLVDYVLLVPILLALFVALRRVDLSTVTLAVGAFFVAVAVYLTTNPAIQMLQLSTRYADAGAAEKATLLGGAQALLAGYTGTAFQVSYVLGSLSGILIGVVMLRSTDFGRLTGWLAIVGNAVGFALYLPAVGVILATVSGVVLWAWYIALARDLFRLPRSTA